MDRIAHASLFESLEPRLVLADFSWSSEEVYLVELVNRARADPSAEALRTGVDLTAELSAEELERLVPSEPLALHPALTVASRAHSRDMSDRNFFDHENPDGDRAQQRADAAGYDGSVGENIAAGYDTVDEAHVAWLESVGHRRNVLSLWTTFRESFHYDEIGVGFYFPGSGVSDYHTYYTQVFGYSGSPQRTYLLGVVYDDDDSDDFYSVGEGRAGVRVTVTSADNGTFIGSYLTDEAGNYQVEVPGGDYVITFVDVETGLGRQETVSVEYNTNLKVDSTGDELTDVVTTSDNAAGEGAIVGGSSAPNGVLTVATLNTAGRPIAFRQTAGGWEVVDLQTLTGSPNLTGQIETWTDPRDGLTYAAASSAEGLLLFQRSAQGLWTFRNLTDEIDDAGILVGDITVFSSRNQRVFIAGLDVGGDVLLFNQTGGSGDDGYLWTSRNLSETDLASQGQSTPEFSGRLISFVTTWNALNIAGLDHNGDIQAIWIAGGMDRWRISNLSESTGAPTLAGGLTAYLTSWSAINLVGTDVFGNVSATWWVPSFGGDWVSSDLTALLNGPQLQASSMTSFVTPWGATNVAGLDAGGELVVYWWAPGAGWSITTLSDAVADAVLPVGELRGLTSRGTGAINILGASGEGDVLRYWWQPGGSWAMQNLTELT
ncbi:MAG TPA: CAP domain-containing protein [Phycisphaerales bacterium]|nr:CAP domain-containing protein [Phycisphaerales bacterium]